MNSTGIVSNEVSTKNLAQSTNLESNENVTLSSPNIESTNVNLKDSIEVEGTSYISNIYTPTAKVSNISSQDANENVNIHGDIVSPQVNVTGNGNIIANSLSTDSLSASKYCDLENNCLDFEKLKEELEFENDITNKN